MKKIVFSCMLLIAAATTFASVAGANPDYKHPSNKMLHHKVHHAHHVMIPFDHYKI